MKRTSIEKVFVGVLSVSLMTNTMGLLQPVQSLDYKNNISTKEVSEDTIGFSQEYAKVGETLNVNCNLTGTLTYQWIVGDKVVSYASSYTPIENDLEKFITVEVSNGIKKLSAKTYFSRLPVVYINTENSADVTSKDYYINGEMKIQGNQQFNLGTTTLYDGAIEIKGRGNSTWGLPKKPYKIKLDSKTNLFSMGKNKHWVLLANYYDSSSLRNTLSYDLSGALDMPQTETVHTGVVLNGKYVGVYQFCEQIRVDEKRVDVLNWDDEAKALAKIVAKKENLDADELESYLSENLGWATSGEFYFKGTRYLVSNYDYIIPSIEGGYLLELDSNYDEVSKFKTNSQQPIMFKAPEFANSNQDMMNYVQEYIQAYENAVNSKDYHALYNGNMVHYSDLFDMNSLVDYWLVTELFFNEDGMKKSTYMYKDIDGKFKMGPIWDMDWSSGASQSAAIPTDQWQTLYYPTYYNPNEPQLKQWYRYLIQDPYFVSRVKKRYDEIRNDQITEMMTSIDEYRIYLKEAGVANSLSWYNNSATCDNEIVKLKTWLTERLDFMDEQFSSLSKLYTSLGVKVSSEKFNLTDHNKVVLPTEGEYDGVSNARNLINIEINISDSKAKKVALYGNGELIDIVAVIDGKVSFEHTLPKSGNYVLQAYKLDANDNVIDQNAITANLLVNPSITMELQDIQLVSLPTKLSYYQGEELDLTGLQVNALYNTGNSIPLDLNKCEISSLSNEIGTQIITVSYDGKTASFEVEVKEVQIESLTITQLPNKLEYYVGDKLDLTGLVVEAGYSNGTVRNITDYVVSKLNNKVGKQIITINYQGYEVTFEVTVLAKEVAANKIALSIAIDMAEAVTQEELNKVVPTVVTEFNNALQNAKEVYADDQAVQEEINDAFNRLAKAMQMLEFIKGDKVQLQKIVDQIAGLTASDYIDSTWNAMLPALTKANEVLSDVNAMQEEVDQTHSDLVKAFLNLRLKPNKDLLGELINKANSLNAVNYTMASMSVVNEALDLVKAVYDNPEATSEEVKEAEALLTKALASLEAKPETTVESDTNTVKSGDTLTSVKTGDEIPAYGLLAGLALLVSIVSSKKKKHS